MQYTQFAWVVTSSNTYRYGIQKILQEHTWIWRKLPAYRCTAAVTWWRHQMEAFSALLAICAGNSPVPGEFPAQRPVTRSFDVFFYLCLNKRLSKQSWGWWFETPDRRQAIIWTNVGLMSIGPLRTYFSENLIKIQQFSLKKLHVKMSSAKWRPSCLGLNVLTMINPYMPAQ